MVWEAYGKMVSRKDLSLFSEQFSLTQADQNNCGLLKRYLQPHVSISLTVSYSC